MFAQAGDQKHWTAKHAKVAKKWGFYFPNLPLVLGFQRLLGAHHIIHAMDNDSAPQLRPRVLGLDVGARRIGVAVSDPLRITAQGLTTILRQNKRKDLAQLAQVIREYEIAEIVVGYPLRLSGAEGTQSEKMQVFAEELRKHFNLPVHLWDERLTSSQAHRILKESEISIEKRGKAVDRMAAMLILQSWMEARGS